MAESIKPSHPSSDTAPAPQQDPTALRPAGPYVGRPLDGSQYLDVVEEQEYADRRPTAEEQRPRRTALQAANRQATDVPPKP